MSIFGKIKNAIFGGPAAASSMPASTPAAVNPASSTAEPSSAPLTPTSSGAQTTATTPAVVAVESTTTNVDIAPILDQAVAKSGQKLDWKRSIVDLMKALNLDSSLSARKELAQELKYTGNINDSAAMNIWLHKAVMKKLAENGGKVPADLAD